MAFHPTDLGTALRVWIDPSQGVTKDGNDQVSSITNQGTPGGTATQATAADKPTFVAKAYKGRPGLQFDHNNQNLKSSTAIGISGNGARHFAWSASAFSDTGQIAVSVGRTNSTSNLWGVSDNAIYGFFDNTTGLTSFGNLGTTIPQVHNFEFDGSTNVSKWTDNSLIQSTNPSNSWSTTDDGYVIGNWNNNDFPYDGIIYEVMIFDRTLTTAERTDVYDWMSATLSSPTPTLGTETTDGFTVTWTDTLRGENFNVYVSETNTFSTAGIKATVARGTETAAITGLKSNTTYYVWVTAVDILGTDESAEASSVNTTTSTIGAPTSLAAGTPTADTIPVTWTDDTDGTYYFTYQNTTDDSGTATLSVVANQGDGGATICGLTASTTYYIFVKTVDADGKLSAFTSSVSATTAAAAAGNATVPTSLVLQSITRDTATLTWVDGAGNSFVDLYYNTADDFSTATFGTIVAQGTQVGTITGLTAGTTYYFWVKGRHSDDSVSTEVGSVTGATAGASGIAGTNAIEQIRDGMNTHISTVLGTDYKKLEYIREIEKNSTNTKAKGYGALVGPGEPAEEGVNRSYTFEQVFTVVLCEGVERKKNERDQETAALTLATAMDAIYKQFQQYRLGLPSLVIQIKTPSLDEREITEDGGTVILRANFPVVYRQAFN